MKKLQSKKGETLVEALVSILIIALCAVMIMTASITAARINKQVREAQVYCDMDTEGKTPDPIDVTVGTETITVTQYNGGSGSVNYYFYVKG